MYDNTKQLNELRSLLEGKTITKIETPNALEAICKFVLSDGSSFRLHATDLGFWIAGKHNTQGYQSFNDLAGDYYAHSYPLEPQYNYEMPDANIQMIGEMLVISSPVGKEFKIKLSHLSAQELKIVQNPIGVKILASYISMGEIWAIGFRKDNSDCPPDLIVQNQVY